MFDRYSMECMRFSAFLKSRSVNMPKDIDSPMDDKANVYSDSDSNWHEGISIKKFADEVGVIQSESVCKLFHVGRAILTDMVSGY